MGVVKTQCHGIDVLNQKMSNSSFGDEKEFTMKSHSALTIESQERKFTGQLERIDQSSRKFEKKSAGTCSGQKTLAGVLVVDDDPKIRKLIRLILENDRYDVFEAEDGQTAIDLLRIEDPPLDIDAIISDLNMPKVDGVEFIAYCQKEWPEIPFIILMGNTDVQLANSFMRQGVTDYLVKPIDAKKLTASVAHVIAQRQFSWV